VDYSKPANRQTDKKNPGIYYSRISGLTHNLVIERPAAVWLYSAAGIFYWQGVLGEALEIDG